MNDTSIACFLSVARSGSFTTSAKELSSTQQAVSRNIQSLEEELGFCLLDRTGRSAELTWEGRRFLHWCLEFDRQLATASAAAERLLEAGSNTLCLGWSDWTGCPPELGEDIRAFSLAYPACQIDVREGDLTCISEFLQEGSLDLAILPEYNAHNMSGVTMSPPFMELPLYAVTHQRYAFTQPTPSPTELTPMKLLVARFGGDTDESTRHRVQFFCAPLGIYPEHLAIMPNMQSTFSELPCGPCYTIAPRVAAADRRGDLCFHPLQATAPLIFVRHPGSASAWVLLFEAFVRQRRRQT